MWDKKANSWSFGIDVGIDANGKRIYKRKRGFKSKDDASEALQLYKTHQLEIDREKIKNVPRNDTLEKYKLGLLSGVKSKNTSRVYSINKTEKELEEHLIENINLIERGLKLIDSQVGIKGGFIDILARDKEGTLCVIEVKNNGNDERLVHQSIYYPSQFEEDVRFIAVAPYYEDRIYHSLMQVHNLIRPIELKQMLLELNGLKIIPFIKE